MVGLKSTTSGGSTSAQRVFWHVATTFSIMTKRSQQYLFKHAITFKRRRIKRDKRLTLIQRTNTNFLTVYLRTVSPESYYSKNTAELENIRKQGSLFMFDFC